jgi:hypothetical protein
MGNIGRSQISDVSSLMIVCVLAAIALGTISMIVVKYGHRKGIDNLGRHELWAYISLAISFFAFVAALRPVRVG